MYHLRMVQHDDADVTAWIDELSDEQCMEVFWLYVDPPEPFLERYPPALLGQALRFALRAVAERTTTPQP
jgi:hypothetical protein